MSGKIPGRIARLLAASLLLICASAVGAGAASGAIVYDNIPGSMPGNLPSLAYEATSTSEFGGQVELAGSKRKVTAVYVDMSSWACEKGASSTCSTKGKAKFSQPITLRMYEVGPGNAVGNRIFSEKQVFKIRYRPSENPACPVTGEGNKGWGAECFSGVLQKIKFRVPHVTVPQKLIIAIAYNTENYGEAPTGVAGPYNSLNVALDSEYDETTSEWKEFAPPSVGGDPAPADAYLDSAWGGAYCNAEEGTGYFRLDPGCWEDFQPTFEVKAG